MDPDLVGAGHDVYHRRFVSYLLASLEEIQASLPDPGIAPQIATHLCNLQLRNLHNASRSGYRGPQASRRRSNTLQLDLPQPPRGVHRDLTLLPPFPTRTVMFCGPRPDLFLPPPHSLSLPLAPLQDDAHRNWQAVVLGKCLVLPIVGTIGFGVGFATKVRCLC